MARAAARANGARSLSAARVPPRKLAGGLVPPRPGAAATSAFKRRRMASISTRPLGNRGPTTYHG
jgi:hypothetical protein